MATATGAAAPCWWQMITRLAGSLSSCHTLAYVSHGCTLGTVSAPVVSHGPGLRQQGNRSAGFRPPGG